MSEVRELIDLVAPSAISVMLLGETGVGKEVVAQTIHRKSPRLNKPYIRINCAALPETLFESELFGYEAGAFSGAQRPKPGLIELADGGTLLFDEVGELPLVAQAKLLRVLETRELTRLGGIRPRPVDVRIVSSTNRDLREAVTRGEFRSDLYYRLEGIPILIPPLRERRDEILELARSFLVAAGAASGRAEPELSGEAQRALLENPWPGNVRELKNTMERAVLLCDHGPILPRHLGRLHARTESQSRPAPPVAIPARTLSDVGEVAGEETTAGRGRPRIALTRESTLEILTLCGGNQSRAAALLGISRGTLLNRLDLFSVPRPRKRLSEPGADPEGRRDQPLDVDDGQAPLKGN